MKGQKVGNLPLDLPYFEDDFFKDFKNTSKYSYQKRPPVPITPLEPLDKESLRESIMELTAIMSSEWVVEGERSSEEILILTPSLTIHCKILGTWVHVLYNPSVGANLMSTAFASTYLAEKS